MQYGKGSLVKNCLVSWGRNAFTKTADAGQDFVGGFGPNEGFRAMVGRFDVAPNGVFPSSRLQKSTSGRAGHSTTSNGESTRNSPWFPSTESDTVRFELR